MAKGKIDGVSKEGQMIRDKMLRHYNVKYTMGENEGNSTYDFNHGMFDVTAKYGLMEYTHGDNTDFSKFINNRYVNITDLVDYYDNDTATVSNGKIWMGKYENYLDYMSYVYGQDYYHFTFDGDTLTDINFTNNSVGSTAIYDEISDFLDYVPLYGSVRNDTRLGKIARQIIGYNEEKKYNQFEKGVGFNFKNPYIINGDFQNKWRLHDNAHISGSHERYDINYGNINNNAIEYLTLRQDAELKENEYLPSNPYDVKTTFDVKPENILESIFTNISEKVIFDGAIDDESVSDYLVKEDKESKLGEFNRGIALNQARINHTLDFGEHKWYGYDNKYWDTKYQTGIFNENWLSEKSKVYRENSENLKKNERLVPEEYARGNKYVDDTEKSYLKLDDGTAVDGGKSFDGEKETQYKDISSGESTVGGSNDIMQKTQKLFNQGKIDTLFQRYHLGKNDNDTSDSFFASGKGKTNYGRGRTLLAKNADPMDENPFCRAWTYRKGYKSIKDTIRGTDGFELSLIQGRSIKYRSRMGNIVENGDQYLCNNTVLQKENGLVRIVPKTKDDQDIKNTMLSIENLAWKDVLVEELEETQRGPNGGRIMWFPPYDLELRESINPQWNDHTFIGRGEKVYTYSNTDRQMTLSFSLLIDHPALLNSLVNGGTDGGIREHSPEITNSDILRFFAGCDDGFKGDDMAPLSDDSDPVNNEPKEDLKEHDSIIFYVFFPNNYSGKDYYNDKAVEVVVSKGKTQESLPRWYMYLLCGINAAFLKKTAQHDYHGYEIEGKGGITDIDATEWGKVKSTTRGNDGKDRYYYYLVDSDKLMQKFDIEDNYKDTRSIGLNSNIVSVMTAKQDNDVSCSFVEFIKYLIDANKIDIEPEYAEYIKGLPCDDENIKDIAARLNDKKISKIEVRGCATPQDRDNSNSLADNRADTLVKFFKNDVKLFNGEIKKVKTEVQGTDSKDSNEDKAKANRCARVEIFLKDAEVNDMMTGKDIDLQEQNANIRDKEARNKGLNNEQGAIGVDYQRGGYENEYEFFARIKKDDDITYKTIKSKFENFTPAYHSMSPEGFNSRLTFLHQCTRQGHTISNSEANGNMTTSASNMAFGRMPVCVIRVGDFINTRAIISSCDIDYSLGEHNWDLNPEGAGVQPMFAKISLNLILLGGQSLEAPVSRLQNAVSFNYYANTGVYDDRSDRVSYGEAGKLVYKYLYTVNNSMHFSNVVQTMPGAGTINEELYTEDDEKKGKIEKVNNYET